MHRGFCRFALCLVAAALACPGQALRAQPAATPDPTAAIRAVMIQSQDDWNRGDVAAFATCYKHAPDILFIGPTITRGYEGMLARYRKRYPDRAAMGTLTFSALQVQPLDAQFATATGHFHLDRAARAGGNLDGYFLLVLEKTGGSWKIIRDDTTALPPAGK